MGLKRLLHAAITLVVVMSAAAAIYFFVVPVRVGEFPRALGGREIVGMIRDANRVEAVRVEVDSSDPKIRNDTKLIQKGPPFDISEKDAALAKALFSDRDTYTPGIHACIFDPGVKLIFHDADGSTVTLIVCLKCGDVRVLRGDKIVGFANFSPGREKARVLAHSIFPNDEDLRALAAGE